MRWIAAILLTVLAGAIPANASAEPRPITVCTAHEGLRFYIGRANHWQARTGERTRLLARSYRGCPRHLARVWKNRAKAERKTYHRWFQATYAKWACIHREEGAWNADTGNGYYGGLQMDKTFQRTHGWRWYVRWGTANKWPVWAQLVAAEDAYKTRGFGPWPNTARECGLL